MSAGYQEKRRSMYYVWHKGEWEQLVNVQALHHGLMVTGADGIGKREFCLALAKFLLCDNKELKVSGGDCGRCQNCELFDAGTHPDFHLLTSETENIQTRIPLVSAYSDRYQNVQARGKKTKPGKIIPIDQIRLLIERFSTQPHISQHKVVLVMPADAMNTNASNALLKLLEEPPENSTLILMTSSPGFLPATIRSRCMLVNLPTPRRESALEWLSQSMDEETASLSLKLANEGPLDAKQFADNGFLDTQGQYMNQVSNLVASNITPLALAMDLSKSDLSIFLGWLHGFVCEVIVWRVSEIKPNRFDSSDLVWSSKSFSVERLYALYDKIIFYKSIVREPINAQLVTEDLILTLKSAIR